jgi:hypothetical protein
MLRSFSREEFAAMPSPFPGMDPYIEGQRWRDFHTRLITVLGEMLTPNVRPRYIVEVEEYVYLAREDEDPDRLFAPDVAVVEASSQPIAAPAAVVLAEPAIHTVPMPARYRQAFLTIRDRQMQNVVTVIELLSPWNKAAGQGRNDYLGKRWNVFYSLANLVEIDLLRGGQRLPTREPLAPADYYAFVFRRRNVPQVEVYSCTLRDRLPTIPIPLAVEDPDVTLDLQAALTTTYDRAGYDYALDYSRPVAPPFEAADADLARNVVKR